MIWIIENLLATGFGFGILSLIFAACAGLFVIAEMGNKLIPILYEVPIKIVSLIGMVVSIWFLGATYISEVWEARLDKAQEQIQQLEEKAKVTNTIVETKVVTKIKRVKEVVYVNTQSLQETAKELDSVCVIPNDVICLHNASASNTIFSRSTCNPDGTAEGVKQSELLDSSQ